MVSDEKPFRGDVLAKIPRETTKTKDITGGLPRRGGAVRSAQAARDGRHQRNRRVVKHGPIVEGAAEDHHSSRRAGAEPRSTRCRGGVHVNVQEGERCARGEQLMDGPSNPHDILNVTARVKGKTCRS